MQHEEIIGIVQKYLEKQEVSKGFRLARDLIKLIKKELGLEDVE